MRKAATYAEPAALKRTAIGGYGTIGKCRPPQLGGLGNGTDPHRVPWDEERQFLMVEKTAYRHPAVRRP